MKLASLFKSRELITIVGAILLIVVVGLAQPRFIAYGNLTRVANSTVILALLAAGAGIVIITRNIDVSVGSTLCLTGIIGGLMFRAGMPTPVVILVVLLLGTVLGALNGIGVAFGGVPSIVMTLGTMGAYRGLGFVITRGNSIEDIPTSYKQIAVLEWIGMPALVWVSVVLLVAIMVLMARTVTGRHLYATGDNVTGARLIGVRTSAVTIGAFAISGALAAAGALVFLAQIGSVSNQAGVGMEMRAIAAAVIGGVALSGGVGTVLGSTFGALFITTATSSLTFLGIPGFWSDTVIGAILLVALFADARVRASLERRRLVGRYRRDLGSPQPSLPGPESATPSAAPANAAGGRS